MASSAARNKWRPADGHRGYGVESIFQRPRMTHLENAVSLTIVRLGKAVPKVFFSSAVDFILPVNCRRSTTAVRAAGGAACRGSASGEFILLAVPDAARTASCRPPAVDRQDEVHRARKKELRNGFAKAHNSHTDSIFQMRHPGPLENALNPVPSVTVCRSPFISGCRGCHNWKTLSV